MLAATPQLRIVLTTVANPEEAERLARALVEERLAACVSFLPAARSIYRWQGRIESAEETLLLLKTAEEKLAALEARIKELHSYQTPEFVVLKAAAGSQDYLEWLLASLAAER
jgi:periplasmic divalent cation tolerance protein